MTECVPFLKVADVSETIKWYEMIGFTCTATNLIWEPRCEINWARLEWEQAAFMIGPDERDIKTEMKDSSLWFNVKSVDAIIELLQTNHISIDIEPETFYGRKVVGFQDLNGFQVFFSCELR